MSTPAILALGEPLAEFVARDDGLFQMGYGGDTMNTCVAAVRQGATAGYITALGEDMFGEALRALWVREGVDATHVLDDPNATTGVYFVKPHGSARSFTYLRRGSAASRYRAEDLPVEAIEAAEVLHVSAISQAVSVSLRAAVERAIVVAQDAGTTVSFDTNLRLGLWDIEEAREAIFAALARTDIIFPSDDEARLLFELEDVDQMVDRFLEFGAKIVVMTCGADGAILATQQERTRIPPGPSDPVDSTGAGDSFAGAFLAHWIEDQDALRAAKAAANVAAAVVSGFGAIDPIPYRT